MMGYNICFKGVQGFYYLSKSGSWGRMTWKKQLAKTRLEKLNGLFYFEIVQKHGKLLFRAIKNVSNIVSKNILQNLPQT